MIYYIRNDVDDLLGFKYNNTVYYYIKNIQDDIIGIIDSNNNIIANYKYDSWGNIISITDNNGNDISNNTNHIANINPFRYRSYYYDTETNLYYLNSRYYNPTWGRFINADGIIGANEDILGYNLYAYCGNNPIIQKDDSGKAAIALGLGFGTLGLIALGLAAQKAKKGISSFFSSIASSLSGVKPYKPVSKPKTSSKAKTQTKSKEKTQTVTVTQAKEYARNNPQKKPCTEAYFAPNSNDITRGNRLTIKESTIRVRGGQNVFCDTQIAAYAVVAEFDDPIHHSAHHNGDPGYYPHYHPWKNQPHPHIWYY